MAASSNNKKLSPKSTFVPIPSAITKSPFEDLNDGENDRKDSIESFLILEGCNQSQAVSLMPSVSNKDDEKGSDFSPNNNDDEDLDESVANKKEETSSEEESDDGEDEEEDDDVPLIPTKPKLVGLLEDKRIKNLSCLLSSKINYVRLHNNLLGM